MFRKFLTLLVIILFSSYVFAQQAENKSNEQIIDVNFCDLSKAPSDYENKIIRVTAIYRYGFDWSDLYCPGCGFVVRVILDDNLSIPKKYKKLFKWSEAGRTLKVTFVGKFGAKNKVEKQIAVQYVESAKLVSKSSSNYESLPEKDKAKANCIIESKQN